MKLKLLFIFLFQTSLLFCQTYSVNKVGTKFPENVSLIKHAFYEIGFNTKYHLPAWTYYSLTKQHLELAVLDRKGSFVKDPFANSAEQAGNDDYSASGYDKGHMVPCEDMSFSEQAMKETFYYSNCAPQTTELNRGEWKALEELAREWAVSNGELLIFSGPVLEEGLKTIGEDKIPVPEKFYKILALHSAQNYKAIAFIMPNQTSILDSPENYACSIDSVEKLTGLDFFMDFPDNLEAQFEGSFELSDWQWKKQHHQNSVTTHSDTSNHRQVTQMQEAQMVQCKGKTKKGARCKKKTSSKNGYCNVHGGN